MNALRNTRTFALVGLMTLVALGLTVSSASAHDKSKSKNSGGFSINFNTSDHCKSFGGSNYCNYPSYCGTNYCSYPSYCNFGSYGCYDSLDSYSCVKPVCYPVVVYDCFGRPTIVWQTGNGSNSMAIVR